MSGNPRDLRWADAGMTESASWQELIIAIGNLTAQVMRIADHFDPDGSR